MQYLQIESSNLSTILELFNKDVDDDGYIIEKRTGKRLICPYSEREIHKDNFSILPGSATFVNNKSFCFAKHLVKKISGSDA